MTTIRIAIVAVSLAACASESPLDARDALEQGGKTDGSEDVTVEDNRVTISGEVGATITNALLAAPDLVDIDDVDGITLIDAPKLSCAAYRGKGACIVDAFDAGPGDVQWFFYDVKRPNAQRVIWEALSRVPEAVNVNLNWKLGRINCNSHPQLLASGVPDICFIANE